LRNAPRNGNRRLTEIARLSFAHFAPDMTWTVELDQYIDQASEAILSIDEFSQYQERAEGHRSFATAVYGGLVALSWKGQIDEADYLLGEELLDDYIALNDADLYQLYAQAMSVQQQAPRVTMWDPEPLFDDVLGNFGTYRQGVSSVSAEAVIQIARRSYLHEFPQGAWISRHDDYMRKMANGAISLKELDGYEECAGTAQRFCAAVYGALLARYEQQRVTDIEYKYAELMLASFLLENIGDICPSFVE